jgi:hypothetical protein
MQKIPKNNTKPFTSNDLRDKIADFYEKYIFIPLKWQNCLTVWPAATKIAQMSSKLFEKGWDTADG